jgi:hypothetical protein
LDSLALDVFVFLQMYRTIWGLPQAGILVNQLLQKRLLPHGYYKFTNTPGLWKHSIHPIAFTLVINNFGAKNVGKGHADHLMQCIKRDYELTKDWTGNLYCGIQLVWDYNAQTPDISMPGYIKKVLKKYKHCVPSKLQHCPYWYGARIGGTKSNNVNLKVIIVSFFTYDELKSIHNNTNNQQTQPPW